MLRMIQLAVACAAVLVAAVQVQAAITTFANTTSITVPTDGIGDPFPSVISVSGITSVTDLNVNLFGLSHTYPDDILLVLEGPTGAAVSLMSDAGDYHDVSSIDFSFDDEAAGKIPDLGPLTAGSYQVSQHNAPETLPSPAPNIGFGGDLSMFDGLDPTGDWNLFVFDEASGDGGSFAGGWSLTFDASSSSVASPVPEPSTFAIWGLLALCGIGWRRRRKAA